MKRLFLLLAAVLLLLAMVAGCQDDSTPMVTRLYVNEDCGIVPMDVDFTAYFSGGNETGDPLGANNNLDVQWTFGDGGTGTTSQAYHTYTEEGEWTVTVVGTDPDGNQAKATHVVTVFPDSLDVMAGSNFPDGNVTTADTISFDLQVSSCNIEYPTVPGDSVKVEILWEMGDPGAHEYNLTSPQFRYDTAGQYEVNLTVFYPYWAVVRNQTLTFNVTDAP